MPLINVSAFPGTILDNLYVEKKDVDMMIYWDDIELETDIIVCNKFHSYANIFEFNTGFPNMFINMSEI